MTPGDPNETEGEGMGLIKREATGIVRQDPTPMELIEKALALGPEGITVIERLSALQIQMEDRSAKREYVAAMARLADIMPVVDRNGRVKYEGKDGKIGMDRTYGKYEDIDEKIRPLYTKEGFSVAWKTEEGGGGKIRMVGTCSHRDGHSEEFKIDLPHDSSGGKNAIQAIGSSVLGYGRRMLTTMIFNVRIAGVDTDGEDLTPIGDKAALLRNLCAEAGTTEKVFLSTMVSGVEKLEDVPERDYQRLKTALETRKRARQERKP